ncbi:MAG: EAL domain-containing protein [Proteobacteria bacterium]|nr:EAL domain-containing protein [Pseudomonadota bacterium]
MSQVFVGRQPILDRAGSLVAYELLFRDSAEAEAAVFENAASACSRLLVNTFMSMGVGAVIGDKQAFVNVDESILQSELVEALPQERVVLEILEDVSASPGTQRRCAELREVGFTLALDDYVKGDAREPLLEWVDLVKVDLTQVQGSDLRSLVRALRRSGVEILAEKVETQEEFALCRELGFDYFQGFYFARPETVEGAAFDPARSAIMRVLRCLFDEAESVEIADALKGNVNLSINLLRLVNSAAAARPSRIGNVVDAVNYLGRAQLSRWVTILFFAGDGEGGVESPLLQAAARRGRLMELLAGELDSEAKAQADGAFLVGMLSLADAVSGVPLEVVVDELSLAENIGSAIVGRTGLLGQLLELTLRLEAVRPDLAEPLRLELGIEFDVLQRCEYEAFAYVHALLASPGEAAAS